MSKDTRCRHCGAAGETGRFCTTCGTSLESASSPRRRRKGGLIAGVALLLVVAGAGAAFALTGPGSDAVGAPSPTASPTPTDVDPTGPASQSEPAETTAAPAALPLNPTVIVLDASGSMNEDDAPGPRIDAAKTAAATLVADLPDGSPVGLIVYGTSTDSSDAAKTAGCQDIKTLVPVGPLDRSAFTAAVDGVDASGYTPLGSSLRAAAAQLPADGRRTVIVVSDGDDTCQPPEPCAVAKEIGGNGLTIHTVGFRVSGTARDALTCIAQATGGRYVDASNAAQLQAFLRTAADPNATVNTLTHTGFGDLTIGMTAEAAKSVDSSIDPATTGTVVIVWRDCDLTFTDGTLVTIEPHAGSSTQDGLAVGDDAGKAAQLYGSSAVQTDDGRSHAVFVVEPGSDLGYDITFTPSAAGQLAGPITRIVLCRCKPGLSTAVTAVNADDYLKTPGRWWFRTPDDGWNCSITSADKRVFCDAYFKPSKESPYSTSASYPPVTNEDVASVDCGEMGLVAGSAILERDRAQYGQCGRGEVTEFVYDLDRGVVGPGRILADGQELRAGGFRCFVSGLAVTCAPDPANGVGFTVDQNDRKVYPRDGQVPDLGGTSPAAPTPTTTPSAAFDDFVGTWERHTSALQINADRTGTVMYGSGCCNSVEVPVTYEMDTDGATLIGTVSGPAIYDGSSFRDLDLPIGTEFRFHFEQSEPYQAGSPTGRVIVQDNVIGGSEPIVWCGDIYDGRCGA